MQALILAAGSGNRLKDLGFNCPKCLIPVGDIPIIERTIENLSSLGISNITIVVNYQADKIIKYVTNKYSELNIRFVNENNYPEIEHNNIYSFKLALSNLIKDEDVILIESDIIFDKKILNNFNDKNTNCVVLSEKACYHNGNALIVNDNKCSNLQLFNSKIDNLYKTVNIYYLKYNYINNLNIGDFVNKNGYNHYYEECFDWNEFTPIIVKAKDWYEIDTPEDYETANIIYSEGNEKYDLMVNRFGGHWYFPDLVDCCYMKNPFFTPTKLYNALYNELGELITSYPIGELTNRKNASTLFEIDSYEKVLVGNGVSELINILGKYFENQSVYIDTPTFNEYLKLFKKVNIKPLDKSDIIIFVNPNNPLGSQYDQQYIEDLIIKYPKKIFIIDESFNDFVEEDLRYSFINSFHKNVIVLKSLGKSYSLNGLKLGILTSADVELVSQLHELLPSWNLNCIAQEVLMNLGFYKNEYKEACNKMISERERMYQELKTINQIEAIKTQTNFILIDLKEQSSYDFCVKMFNKYNIFIKNLQNKKGLDSNNLLRLSINDEETNNYVIDCFKKEFSNNYV